MDILMRSKNEYNMYNIGGRRNNGNYYNNREFNERNNMNKNHHVIVEQQSNRYENFMPCNSFFSTLV